MWYCPECGSPNPAEALFCTNCGQPLPRDVSAPARPKKKRTLLWIAVGAVRALLLASGLLFLLLGRTHDARLVRSNRTSSEKETVTTYTYSADGRTVTVDTYVNGGLMRRQEGTVDRNGALLSLVEAEDGYEISREDRENDSDGNPLVIRRYQLGVQVLTIEAEYNAYRVAEKQVYTWYEEDGSISRQQIIEYTDREHGAIYNVDGESGQRVLYARLERVYDGNSLIRQTTFDLEGNPALVVTYTRNQDHYVLTESAEYLHSPDANYTINNLWERVD